MRVVMWDSWELSCEIHETGHVRFMRVVIWDSWEWSSEILESDHLRFLRVVIWDSWEWSSEIHKSYYNFFYKIKIIKWPWKIRECSCEIHERSCSHCVARAHVKFMKVFMWNSWKWSCEIHESGHVKSMKVVM